VIFRSLRRRTSVWNWSDIGNLPDKKECGECKDKVKENERQKKLDFKMRRFQNLYNSTDVNDVSNVYNIINVKDVINANGIISVDDVINDAPIFK
jgi:hypothetical protein